LCGSKGIPVKEVAVDWQEIDGSHLNVVDATIQMLRDMILIKFLYTFRLWGYDDVNY
jgi:dolichyl-phosphate beta-glucosyltransferase